MTYKQKNWRAFLPKAVGCFTLILSIPFLISIPANLVWVIMHPGDWREILAFIALDLFILAGFIWVSFYYLWMFPEITISENGLVLKVLFLRTAIDLNQLDSIQRTHRNRILILLKSKGMLFNRLHGLFIARKWNRGVVLYMSDPKIVDSFEADLRQYLQLA